MSADTKQAFAGEIVVNPSVLERWWPPDLVGPGLQRYLKRVSAVRLVPACPTIATAFYPGGRLELIVSPAIERWSLAARIEALHHECGHVVLAHHPRCKDRQPAPWNAVCDAAIHECGMADPAILDEIVPAVTFDRLHIPACAPEIAYDLLPKQEVFVGGGCGREGFAKQGAEDAATAVIVAAEIAQAEPGRFGRGAGRESSPGRPPSVLPAPPAWVRETIDLLTALPRREERRRSWLREHRRLPGLLPGRYRKEARGATFHIDASGSMPHSEVALGMAAVTATPELRFSSVYIYDTKVSPEMSASDAATILKESEKFGGGTSFLEAAKHRDPERVAVWITDGYPCDGWPSPHEQGDVWVITTDVRPPYGVRIQAGGGKEAA